MKKLLSKLCVTSLTTLLVISGLTCHVQAAEVYDPGVTVVKDEESPTGYTAHFVYNFDEDDRVSPPQNDAYLTDPVFKDIKLVGSFRLLSGDKEISEGTDHSLYDYENGDFCANVHPHTRDSGESGIWGAEWAFDMVKNGETGNYELDVPMISGSHYYYYQINYSVTVLETSNDGEEKEVERTVSVTIDDPNNPSPCHENEANSNSETGDMTHSIVFGKWDSVKQSKSPNLDYTTPYTGASKGTLEYVEYKGSLAEDQDLGVYLPANYDANREEPYKVIYLSHGAGGNETYWFSQPQATNIMDNMIAENPEQEAIVVGLDNTLYNWDYYQIGINVVDYVIPFMEANYNVSTDPQDRAFAGFSMGSMTTTYMAFHYADQFGYFGIFSGCNIGNATFKDGFEYDSTKLGRSASVDDATAYLQEVYENIEPSEDLLNSVVFTMAGDSDTAVYANGFPRYGAYETIRDWCVQYMPKDNFVDGGLVHGSHDIYTWGQCLYTFAKDICWSKEKVSDTPDVPLNPDTPTIPENPNVNENPIVSDTTTDNPVNTTNPVQTSDNTQVIAYATLTLCAAVAFVVMKKRKSYLK